MRSNDSARTSSTTSHVQGVEATSGGLIRSTLGAAAVAGAILTFVWLPAEFGIDPTGVGHLLGLTEMGEIKEQLHAEADADAAAAASPDGVDVASVDSDVIQRLDAIEAHLEVIATRIGAAPIAAGDPADAASSSANIESTSASVETEVSPRAAWRDEVDYTLEPGVGIEIKLVMNEGAVADFEWSANGAVVNHDTHGDGNGQEISYEQGRSVPEQAGQLTAAFTGNHGWYWRNRTDDDVVVTLRTRGEYMEMLRP